METKNEANSWVNQGRAKKKKCVAYVIMVHLWPWTQNRNRISGLKVIETRKKMKGSFDNAYWQRCNENNHIS